MGAIEEVPLSTPHIGSIATLSVAAIEHQGNQVPVRPEELRVSILEHIPHDRQEELLQLLLQFPSVLKRSSEATLRLSQDSRSNNNQEPFYQKQGKIPQAHCPVIEEMLDSWIRLGLIRKANSLFNTPLFCLQHSNGYWIVQDF